MLVWAHVYCVCMLRYTLSFGLLRLKQWGTSRCIQFDFLAMGFCWWARSIPSGGSPVFEVAFKEGYYHQLMEDRRKFSHFFYVCCWLPEPCPSLKLIWHKISSCWCDSSLVSASQPLILRSCHLLWLIFPSQYFS